VGVAAIDGFLLWFAPRQPLSFFVHHQTASHSAYWWAFMLGLLQAQWTFTGYDASAHVSEETVDPRRRVPWGIVNSVAISGVVGKHLTPAPAIWLSVAAAFALSIYSKTHSVITSISVLGLHISYILPVWLGWRARRARSWTQHGPWHLGAYSSAVNVIAISWT